MTFSFWVSFRRLIFRFLRFICNITADSCKVDYFKEFCNHFMKVVLTWCYLYLKVWDQIDAKKPGVDLFLGEINEKLNVNNKEVVETRELMQGLTTQGARMAYSTISYKVVASTNLQFMWKIVPDDCKNLLKTTENIKRFFTENTFYGNLIEKQKLHREAKTFIYNQVLARFYYNNRFTLLLQSNTMIISELVLQHHFKLSCETTSTLNYI